MKKFTLITLLCAFTSIASAGGDPSRGQQLSQTCAGCHGADGNSTISTNPRLAGQHASYLVHALEEYRSGERQNAIMAGFAGSLSDQDIADLAAWFASQSSPLSVLPD